MPPLDLLTLAPGDERTYRFSVLLPDGGAPEFDWSDDNLLQRASSRFAYEWTLSGDGSIPTEPEPPLDPTPPSYEEPLPPGACVNEVRGNRKGNRLIGTPVGDRIAGLAGSDRIRAGAGDDCVDGGPGGDALRGGPGADRLNGGRGRDSVRGGSGDDWIDVRGRGTDSVNCGSGMDRVRAGPHDRLRRC